MLKKINILNFIFIVITLIKPPLISAVMVDQMTASCDSEATKRILEGNKIRQSFVSEANEFGIVAVKFTNYQDISDDSLTFRIKELGSENWHFEHMYKVDQMQNNEYFPFGIPPVTDALEKTYLFELESLSGKTDDSIGVYICDDSNDIVFKLIQGVPAKQKFLSDLKDMFSNQIIFFLFWSTLISINLLFIYKKRV